ncbi:hypothetical protein GTY66_01205 [Streptomyces sp. SID8356]|uniref:WXG100 family type VII secretion target n=1 Tax=unclassified Streptomyces TaxID=2593676 RepID=UPI0003A3B178|nr:MULTISPECIES: WXG100 family type VII secretion target [unclassified Streptomyces]MYT34694.1 hypothetical protein [Streptomyces sp. SID8356]
MSDENQPELTPAEQQNQDEGRVRTQLVVTDATELGKKVLNMFSLGGGSTGGRTSFEGHDLNAIIDLVKNSNPADLENAGEALWRARDAIRSAAKELADHIDKVDWQGESGEAFRKWGKGLAGHATKLSDFADVAGTQITVAGTGLASVRNSMPPPDRRMIQTDMDDILFPARTETNPVYAEALTVEKNRQEAINQINRLASYYAVSEEVLAGLEPPRFDQRLGIDVPKPRALRSGPAAEGGVPTGGNRLSDAPAPSPGVRAVTGGPDGPGGSVSLPAAEYLGPAPVLDKNTSTEINSVATPTAPNTAIGTAPTPSITNSPGPGTTPTPPMAPSFGNSVPSSSSRAAGPVGVPRSASQSAVGPGRPTSAGAGPTSGGGAGTPVGRPSPMASGPSATGRFAGGTQPPMAGQSGVMGGRPVAAHGGTAVPGSSRAGQSSGIVGGTPQRAASGTSGTGGTRGVPRGTVIGAPGSSGSASRGASGSGTKGFTAGGAGLVRGPVGRRKTDRKDEETTGSTRPDYLTEDEETWAARRRGAVPPVVE